MRRPAGVDHEEPFAVGKVIPPAGGALHGREHRRRVQADHQRRRLAAEVPGGNMEQVLPPLARGDDAAVVLVATAEHERVQCVEEDHDRHQQSYGETDTQQEAAENDPLPAGHRGSFAELMR